MHTKGEWIKAEINFAIISKDPAEIKKHRRKKRQVELYGGIVICTGVNPACAPLILNAPSLYDVCKSQQLLDKEMAKCKGCDGEGYLGEICIEHFQQREKLEEIRDQVLARAEIDGGK